MSPRPVVPRLHVVTDDGAPDEVRRMVEVVLAAGAPCVQVRAKALTDRDLFDLASDVAARCRAAGARCIVNDRPDIAMAAGADGVHLGADDLPVAAVRALVGDDLLVGGTARDATQAAQHHAAGADYVGVGPVFATSTKQGLPAPLGLDGLAAVTRAVDVPVIGIAGITLDRVDAALAAGAHGVAVVGAVSRAEDPAGATRALLDRIARRGQGVDR